MQHSAPTPASLRRFGIFLAVLVALLVALGTTAFDIVIHKTATIVDVHVFLFDAALIFSGIGIFTAIFLGRVREIQRHHDERLHELAVTDGLTGAYNYRYLQLQLEKEWARMQRHGHTLACILIDLDNFKKLNDTHGHLAGDVVLQRVAAVLREDLREIDIICRYGGEEFVLILAEKPSHAAGLIQTMERIRHRIEEAVVDYRGTPIRVTASLGGALAPDASIDSPERLIRAADKAMYRAKHAGKNCSKLYDAATMG